jgi:ring-1,2-phenylacetyl-CoA epoxidase subunit PaaC
VSEGVAGAGRALTVAGGGGPSSDPAGGREVVPAVVAYLSALGDDAWIASERLIELVGRAPLLEEEMAIANVALDLLGQARHFYAAAGRLEGAGRDEDAFAYERDECDFRNCLLVERPNGDFATVWVRELLFATWQRQLYGRLAALDDEILAPIATTGLTEVASHADHARLWLLRLGRGTPESHRRAQAAVDELWPYLAELHEPLPGEEELRRRSPGGRGVPAAATCADAAADEAAAVLFAADLRLPPTDWRPSGGRRGRHSEAFGRLLAERQYLHRLHPGASW